ncbi:PorP/SprF family type IX secretion system membrane protein [Flavobacteriaceae bacterium F89]|uniref:PorP/SprF family type IX secretion system membrane protein n=1 Tax=Cerina litoralis TaxID=2874477 RepID=A0AAE3JNM4_9FLAO|nr:PorP/SprF family type IX secretion system membrane protein [Cerina litoralis]MCG2461130.1 PorP/SprF family type IX secretion system membrane protein [Cerina litoralis]
MVKFSVILLVLGMALSAQAQEVTLPKDLRQHNITNFNSSLVNPVFSLDRNGSQSIALWTRWQWQSIDADPTTLVLNYTRPINSKSAFGAGYFQNNTGVHLEKGGVVNYAYVFSFGEKSQLALGVNVYGFQQQFADDRFSPGQDIPLPELQISDNFIMQVAPGIRFSHDRFGIGVSSDNLFDYNFTKKEAQTYNSEKIFTGIVDYAFPLTLFGTSDNTFVRPALYVRTIPNNDTQFGLNAYLSSSYFWAQTGYNSFYGVSVGAGGHFFKNVSLGALVEFGTDPDIKDKDPSFEIVTAFNFGRQMKDLIGEELSMEEETHILTKAEIEAEQQANMEKQRSAYDSIAAVRKEQALAAEMVQKRQRELDSLNGVKLAAAEAAKQQKTADSIAQLKKKQAAVVQQPKPITRKTKGHYEEVDKLEGMAPGFYLIANVFGTKKYYEAFMKTLTDKGLDPKSFYRSENKYNYVYLGHYDTLEEAEKARDSKLNGKYPDRTWIFRVMGH